MKTYYLSFLKIKVKYASTIILPTIFFLYKTKVSIFLVILSKTLTNFLVCYKLILFVSLFITRHNIKSKLVIGIKSN